MLHVFCRWVWLVLQSARISLNDSSQSSGTIHALRCNQKFLPARAATLLIDWSSLWHCSFPSWSSCTSMRCLWSLFESIGSSVFLPYPQRGVWTFWQRVLNSDYGLIFFGGRYQCGPGVSGLCFRFLSFRLLFQPDQRQFLSYNRIGPVQ